MDDDDLDLAAWTVPPPPASLVDGVLARVEARPAVEPAQATTQEVPMATKLRYGAVGAVLAAAAVIAVYQVGGASSEQPAPTHVPPSTVENPPPPEQVDESPTAPKRDVPTAPRRFASPEERTEMLDALAKAKRRRELEHRVGALNGAAGGAGDAIAAGMDPEEVRGAVKELLPLMAECFDMAIPDDAHLEGELIAKLALQSEPDVGTIIADADLGEGDPQLVGNAELTECLHETLMSLELPPLPGGGEATIDYPFAFSTDEPTAKAVAPGKKVDQLVDEANEAVRGGDYERGFQLANDALELDPDNQQAHTAAAIAACNLKDRASAVRHIDMLSGSRRAMMLQVCKRNGVNLDP